MAGSSGRRVVGIGILVEEGFEVLESGGGNSGGGVNLGGSSFVSSSTTAGKQGEVLIHLDFGCHGWVGRRGSLISRKVPSLVVVGFQSVEVNRQILLLMLGLVWLRRGRFS